MPAITFSGLSSGLDTSSWIEALVSVKQTTVTGLQSTLNTIKAKQSKVSTLQASFNSLRSAIEKLTDSKFGSSLDIFANNSAKSSNEDIFTATVTKSAARQSYDIKVEQLATFTSVASSESVGAVANDSTKLSILGIKEGTMSVYNNGVKNSINIGADDTIQDLKARLSSAGVNMEITSEGLLNLVAVNEGDEILIGATNDTSNIKSLLGLERKEDGSYLSSSAMYQVTTASKITEAGIFSTGEVDAEGNLINTTVTTGTFTIGDAEFTIDENTTISGLIAKINSSDDASATAYWDATNSKLVLNSKIEGQSYINIEAGTSNFTDVMGFTNSTWNDDGSVATTALISENQTLGKNAIMYVNGTQVVSSSNTVTSDISRLEGVTINLKSVNTEETGNSTLTVSQDSSSVVSALEDFVKQYNDIMESLDELTASGGALYGETALNNVKRSLRQLVTSSTGNEEDVFKVLSQIGISTAGAGASLNADTNKLSLDKSALEKALNEDSDAVKKVIMGTSSNQDGILSKLENVIDGALASTGVFNTMNSTITKDISRYTEKIGTATLRVQSYQTSLQAKFQAMEDTIAKMQNSYSNLFSQ